jgi:hypothetical protein
MNDSGPHPRTGGPPAPFTAEARRLDHSLLSVEEEENDRQRDQPDQAVFPERLKQGRQIRYDPPEEWDGLTEKDLDHNPQGHQQQSDFRDLTKPFFQFLQVLHDRFSYNISPTRLKTGYPKASFSASAGGFL